MIYEMRCRDAPTKIKSFVEISEPLTKDSILLVIISTSVDEGSFSLFSKQILNCDVIISRAHHTLSITFELT